MKPLLLTAALAPAALFGCAAQAQTYQDSGGTIVPGFVPIQPGVGPLGTASNPMKVSGSFSASLSGFQPSSSGSVGTPISAQPTITAGSTQSLPIGTVVIASNVGATNVAYCQLGSTASTSSQPDRADGGWFAFTVGSATQLTCVTSASTTTVNTLGGSGLPTGAVGGSGGSSSLTSLGPVAPGSVAANSDLIGGVYDSGGIIVASGQQTALQLDPAGGSCRRAHWPGPPDRPLPPGHPSRREQRRQSDRNHPGRSLRRTQHQWDKRCSACGRASGKKTYITGWDVISAGSANFTLEYGTQTSVPCDTGTTALTGAYPLSAQAGISKRGQSWGRVHCPGQQPSLRVRLASVQMSGSLSYTQF